MVMDCCQQVSRACRNFSEHSRIYREREREFDYLQLELSLTW